MYALLKLSVSIIAMFDFSAVRNTGIIDFEFNP